MLATFNSSKLCMVISIKECPRLISRQTKNPVVSIKVIQKLIGTTSQVERIASEVLDW